MRSPVLTTTETTPFINPGDRPIVGVSALLELALWCRKPRDLPPGGPSCSMPESAAAPPAPGGKWQCDHKETRLDPRAARPATAGDPGHGSNPDPGTPAAD